MSFLDHLDLRAMRRARRRKECTMFRIIMVRGPQVGPGSLDYCTPLGMPYCVCASRYVFPAFNQPVKATILCTSVAD
jgi:hypothetical protein